jgi:drug/metabolite transporter (DMT)-like permease
MSLSDTKTDRQGIALVLVGAFCFSLAIPLVRWTHGLNTTTIAFYRALFALVFLCTLLVRFHDPVRFTDYRASMGALVVLGLAVSLTVVLYTYALQRTTAANAVLLVNSAPIYVAVFAPLVLKEPRVPHAWASLGLAIAGIACVSDPARLDLTSGGWHGIAAAALSGFTYAFVLIIGRSLHERVSGLTQNLWSQGIVALVLLPWALRSSGAMVVSNLPLLVPLGVFTLGLSFLLYFQGLHRISVQVVSVVALFEPVSGIVMGLVFFAEVPTLPGWIGGILILASIYLVARD